MIALFRTLSVPDAIRHRTRTALTVAGVALGVATLVAIDLVNGSSLSTIDDLVSAYAGRSELTARAASGTLPRGALDLVRATDGVASAAGSIQGALIAGDQRTTLPFLAGTGDEEALRDHILERGSPPAGDEIALGREAARLLGADVGGRIHALLPAGVVELRVSGVYAERGFGRANGTHVASLPFTTAERLTLREGRLDAIDLRLRAGASAERVAASIRERLPGAVVETPQARGGQTKKLVQGLQTLLQVISALALFIAMFLVFNTMSIAVTQRKRELGIARALGALRRDVVGVHALEASLVGIVAAIVGIAAGVALGQGLLATVNDQIRLNFVAGLADQLVVPWPRLAAMAAVAVGASVAGAVVPALRAASVPVREAIFEPPHAAAARPLRLRLLGLGAFFAALTVAALAAQRASDDPGPGSAAALAVMLAIAASASPLLALGVRALGPVLDRAFGPTARLARDSVLRNPGRAAVTAAALSAALTMVIGMASTIESERRTIFEWVDQAVNADLFVSAAAFGSNSAPIPLDPSLGDRIERIAGVRAVDRFRQVRIPIGSAFAALGSVDVHVYATRGRLIHAAGTRAVDITSIAGRDEVFISDNYARFNEVRQGDRITLRTPDGPRDFAVAAVFIDYTSDQGLIFMDRRTYIRHFHDSAVDSFAVMVDEPARLAAVRAEIERLEGGALWVLSNQEFKDSIRQLVDDFFSTTYVMEAIALLVGVLGVANTMLVTVLERRREIGVLRAVGASRRQVRSTVLIEAGTIGASGAVLGLVGGAALTTVTLVIVESTTGWLFPYVYAWPTALSVAALATLAAVVAGLLPARSAARQQVAVALAYE